MARRWIFAVVHNPFARGGVSSYAGVPRIESDRSLASSPPLLVFDLDGTLCETADDLISTLNVVLAHEGAAPVAGASARTMVGRGARDLIRRGLAASNREVSPQRIEQLFGDFLAHYNAHVADHSFLFPGVTATLDRFAAAGSRFAVCTNKIEAPSVKLLELLGVAHRFSAICGQDTFAVCKPHPEALLQTIARAGGIPARSIMVGDSKTDIDTARAAGIPVIAVDFGYTDVHVSELGPDAVISHFDELWDAVARLPI